MYFGIMEFFIIISSYYWFQGIEIYLFILLSEIIWRMTYDWYMTRLYIQRKIGSCFYFSFYREKYNKKWLLQIYHIKYLYRIVPCYTCIKLWISSFELEYYKGKKCKFLLILSIKYNKNQTRFNIMHFHY